MHQLKALLPFIASFAIYFLALNSPMYKQMNHNDKFVNKIQSTPVEKLK